MYSTTHKIFHTLRIQNTDDDSRMDVLYVESKNIHKAQIETAVHACTERQRVREKMMCVLCVCVRTVCVCVCM